MSLLATEWQPFLCLPIANKLIMPGIMNQALSMGQAPTIRASRALRSINVRKMCVRALALARRKSLTAAAISAAAVYAGIFFGSDQLTYISASLTLGFAYLAESSRKGGDK